MMIRFAIVAILFCAVAALHAQAPGPANAPFDQLVEMLSHDRYEMRQRASTELMIREDVTDEQLGEAIRQADTPEVRHRLVRIAMHHFFANLEGEPGPAALQLNADAAAIGVSFSHGQRNAEQMVIHPHQHPLLESPAMLIAYVFPGFPAYAHLQPGDLITAVNERTFGNNLTYESFAETIRQFKPGERISMDVVRGGRKKRVHLRLAHHRRLDIVNQAIGAQHNDPALFLPWRQHLNQMAGDPTPSSTIELIPMRDDKPKAPTADPAPNDRADEESP